MILKTYNSYYSQIYARFILFLILILGINGIILSKPSSLDTAQVQEELEELYKHINANPEKSLPLLDFYNKCLETTTEFRLQSKLYSLYGLNYYLLEDSERALEYYNKAVYLANKTSNLKYLATLHYNIGLLFAYLKDDFFQANQHFEKSIKYSDESGDNLSLALSYIALGYNFRRLEQYQEAQTNYKKALSYAEKPDVDSLHVAEICLYLSELYYQIEDLQNSNQYLNKVKTYILESGNNRILANYYKQKSQNTESQNFNTAHDYAEKSIQYAEKSNYSDVKLEAYLQAARLKKKLGKLKQAYTYLDKIDIYMNRASFQNQVDFYRLKSELFAQAGNYKKAREYILKSTASKEKLISEKNVNILSQLKNRRAVTRRDKEMLEQKMKLKEQEEELFKRKTIYINASIFVMILLIAVVSFILYRSSKKYSEFNTKLKHSNEMLHKKDLEKSRFIDSITHELRTPLYTISGLIELLRTTPVIKDRLSYLNILSFSSSYLSNFVENMISINAYKQSLRLEKKVFNLRELVENIINSIKIIGTNNRIETTIEPSIPEKVVGDAHKLSQILFNLINNANKFTNDGNIKITIRRGIVSNNKMPLYFEVEDSGIGISEANKEKIFQAFYRGKEYADAGTYDGTGIGLSVVKKLIEMHGGKIELESKLGEGARFFFMIEYDIVPISQTIENTLPKESESLAPATRKNDTRIKVLLVEDNKINQMVVSKILERNNINCDTADNGKQAIEKVRQNQYDLVLMDYLMPVMNGLDAIAEIRTFDEKKPIFALTAISQTFHQQKFLDAGANKVLSKPIEPNKLIETITNSFKLTRNS